jgi:hypothetical protein
MKRRSKYFLIIPLGLFLLLSTSCKDTIKSLSDLSVLRNELIKEYKEQNINVVIQNSNVLGISFINSSFNNIGEQERAYKAKEIALFAMKKYPSIASVERIWVSFVKAKSYIIFHSSEGLGTYLFEKNKLAPRALTNESRQQGAVSSYNSSLNLTDVYLRQNLQLYSDPRSGITLSPHFTTAGDNVTAPKAIIPESVVLEFSTYSDKRMFKDSPKLFIYADGQRVFSGTAQLNNVMGSDAEKSVNEFLSQEISYSQFVQLTNGRRVKITLGQREFELRGEDLEALRSLRRCAEELKCAKL